MFDDRALTTVSQTSFGQIRRVRAVDRAPVNVFRNHSSFSSSLPLLLLSLPSPHAACHLSLSRSCICDPVGDRDFAMSLFENKRKRSWTEETQATPEKDSFLELDLSPLPKVIHLTVDSGDC